MFHEKGTLTSSIVQQNILSRAIKVTVSLIGRYVGTSDGGMHAGLEVAPYTAGRLIRRDAAFDLPGDCGQ